MNDSPRLIGRREAAAYCGVTPTCFSMWVASRAPPARQANHSMRTMSQPSAVETSLAQAPTKE